MTWNYRVMRKDTGRPYEYGIHEVYYDEEGKIVNWTEDSADLGCYESLEELKEDFPRLQRSLELPGKMARK